MDETKIKQQLRYIKTRKNGQVECVNIWDTGWQELVVRDKASFDQLKTKVELEDYVLGFIPPESFN
jgi:hypothetical protein